MGQYGYALSVSLDVAPAVIGVGARILSNTSMPASGSSIALGLASARLIYSRRALELPVTFSITANAAGFRRIYRLSGQSGTLDASFNSANLVKGIVPTYKLTAAAGSYAIAGVAVSMEKGTTTEIVSSGLTLHLDAGNAAGYPGTGTTWTDLSGNGNNGTLVDALYSSANGGFFAFVTANNYVNFLTYSQPAYSTETSFTWDLWVYPKSITVGPIMGDRGNDLQFTKLMVIGFSYYNHISGTDNKLGNQMPLNVWQHICIVKDGTNFYYYRNSILIDSNTSSITKPSRPFWVGADPTAVEDSDTNIASVAVYSRALTDAEITQNFNALRGRFGL